MAVLPTGQGSSTCGGSIWQLAVCCLLFPAWLGLPPAQAMSLRELRTLESLENQGEQQAQYYLSGLLEGALETNDWNIRQGKEALFCLNGRKLEPEMLHPLLQAELQRNVDLYEAGMPVALVLLNALTGIYTC